MHEYIKAFEDLAIGETIEIEPEDSEGLDDLRELALDAAEALGIKIEAWFSTNGESVIVKRV